MGLLALVASLALAASSPAATTIGDNLEGAANGGVCVAAALGGERTCTDAQATLAADRATAGLTAPADGVIVRWRVLSGVADSATVAVKLRLRVLRGHVGAGGGTTAFVDLPLAQPGLHSFATRLPIREGDRLGVDSVVTAGNGGQAFAPIARVVAGVGTIEEWVPSLAEDIESSPTLNSEGRELLLNADVEPDADHDGYGDQTQDQCPTSFSRQTPCPDRQPPRTKLTYPNQQDFLAMKNVFVRLRSNEAATAFAGGQLEFRRGKRTFIYGLYGTKKAVGAGKKVVLRLKLPKTTRDAAEAALASGRKIVVKVTVSATDSAGNRSGTTVAAIRPPQN